MIPLHPLHAPLIAAIHRDGAGEAWDAGAMTALLALPACFGFLEEDNAGFILCQSAGGEAEILTLVVAAEMRRRGLARRLLSAACAEAERRGASAMFLEVATDNLPALGLYRDQGFQDVGRRPRYYRDGTDALVLRRALDPKG